MAEWIPTRRAVVAGTIAALVGGGIMWLITQVGNLASGLRPSFEEGFLIVLAAILAVVIIHLWLLRKRFDPALIGEAKAAVEQRIEMQGAADGLREELSAQNLRRARQEAELAALAPKAEWADSLIERERGSAATYLDLKVELWKREHLDDAEPYFEVALLFNYTGAVQIVIGETISGHLDLNGSAFAREPVVETYSHEKPPLVATGPTGGCLRLRQYVNEARASEIKERLAKRVVEIEFWSRNFAISVCKKAFDGEVIANGQLIGDYLAAAVDQPPRSA